MFEAEEIVRVLTGAIMEILPDGGVVYVPKNSVKGDPLDERFCVQIDARSEDEYAIRVIPLTEKQKREITGRTEAILRSRIEADGWTIKVWHYRTIENAPDSLLTKWQAKRYGYKLLSKGGETGVEITSADGKRTFSGSATCSPDDAYCRAEGRAIALDRAVAALDAENFPTMEQLVAGGYPDGFSSAAGAQS